MNPGRASAARRVSAGMPQACSVGSTLTFRLVKSAAGIVPHHSNDSNNGQRRDQPAAARPARGLGWREGLQARRFPQQDQRPQDRACWASLPGLCPPSALSTDHFSHRCTDTLLRSATSALSPRMSAFRPRPTSRASRRRTRMTSTSPRTPRCFCARPRTGSRRTTTPCSA